jgi:hypothetical protein
MFRIPSILICILSISVFSCTNKLKLSKIAFDSNKDYYYYNHKTENFPLRFENNKLVTQSSIDSFLFILKTNKMKYNLNKTSENSAIISEMDNDLINIYSAINSTLLMNNSDAALFFASELLVKYPDAYKFTDIAFFQAQAWLLKNNSDSADYYYNKFLDYSESKYSKRFHGYYNNDSIEVCFNNERQYAKKYLQRNSTIDSLICYKTLEKRYYYESNSQGFVWNKEDYGYKQKLFPWFGLSYSRKYSAQASIGVEYLIKNNIALNFKTSASKYNADLYISLPIQLYKSHNNRIGFKILPILFYNYFYNPIGNDKKNSFIVPCISLSAGYRFTQSLYIGVSYLKSFSQNNESNNINYSLSDEFDTSLYYQLLKGFSFKAGLVNGHPLVGFTLTGIFMGYNQSIKSWGINSSNY